ncbi:putative helicase [Candidatus Gastranaerophilus sp. (ex Termes propinquus)]|nr:putative helicase [Candidatus Gastranaerophilus sp. (ex Termes propinquus)]
MYGFNFELDDFQKEAIQHIKEGKSTVVCAPTGAGKTCIAQSAIHLALESGKRIFYTTPLKALSNQKFFDFSRAYGEGNVGLLTGDTTINRDAQIVVMTTEVFRNMLYGTTFGSLKDNLQNVKYVVLDEVHYMNDEQRGTVWEESIIYCPTNIQLIALSATVANSPQLTSWMNTVHSKTELVYTDFRPVPLRFFYYDSSQPNTILPLLTPDGQLNNKIRPESRFKHFAKNKKPKNPVAEITLALNEKNMLPAIYFTFSRKKCDENAQKCASLDLLTSDEKQEVIKLTDEYIAENPYLYDNPHLELVKNGVAAHHAGLLPGWKVLVEKLFQKGLIKMVFATETLAAGINMPARTTIISSISKRGDNGHRMLTSNEFLQMSGRAGRRGMDEVGYVVVVGTPFQTPEEVAELALSGANPLESKFSPSYSMVLNLLQRFSLDEARELILKTFGYFSSTDRISPLLLQLEDFQLKIDAIKAFGCPDNLTEQDVLDYCKWKNMYVEMRTLIKTLHRQASKKKGPVPPEVQELKEKSNEYRKKMESYACCTCKRYSKHRREIEVMERYEKKAKKMQKEIEFQKDVFWQKFLAHKEILERSGCLENDFPTQRGKTPMALRCENELFMAEIILSGVLDNLAPFELASVVCALSCEEMRGAQEGGRAHPPCGNVRKAFSKIHDIMRKIHILERDSNIENQMNLNSHFSYLAERWVSANMQEENNPAVTWQEMFSDCDFSQGDVVRAFKRTIDLLRQLTIVENASPNLAQAAREAIRAINKEPINVD